MLWTILRPVLMWLGLVFGFVMPVASLLTWAERRQSAMIQDRLGPNRANILGTRAWGIWHFLADALKMMFKEDFVPAKANRWLFSLAPILALAPVLIAFALIPFGPPIRWDMLGQHVQWADLEGVRPLQVFGGLDFGLLLYFAVASLANYGATLAGWASYNKWALLGGMRASSQMMAYEVAMGLSIMGVFVVTGALAPEAIVNWQLHHTWGVVVQPVAFVLFLTAAIAETKRGPFDIPEGESEIVGYFVEYSGLRFGMFYLSEFIEVVFAAAVLVTVFFGGWSVPFLSPSGWHFPGGWAPFWPHWAVVLTQILAWGAKVVFLCWAQLMIRWTLPRFRPDQLLQLGWKRLLPLSLANIMVTAMFLLWQGN